MKVVTLESQDAVSRRDISAAYRYFGINSIQQGEQTDDSRIIGIFQSQSADSGLIGQQQARTHLYKLGLARTSQVLINAAHQSVDTYEDALSWLGNGVNKNTADEGLIAVYTLRVSWCTAKKCCSATCADVACRPRTAKRTKKSDRKQYPLSPKRGRVASLTTGYLPAGLMGKR